MSAKEPTPPPTGTPTGPRPTSPAVPGKSALFLYQHNWRFLYLLRCERAVEMLRKIPLYDTLESDEPVAKLADIKAICDMVDGKSGH